VDITKIVSLFIICCILLGGSLAGFADSLRTFPTEEWGLISNIILLLGVSFPGLVTADICCRLLRYRAITGTKPDRIVPSYAHFHSGFVVRSFKP